MSDYWLNRIGSASTATTPSGSVPSYGLAYDMGTADWPDSQTFNAAVTDAVARRRGQDLARIEQAKAESDLGWFQEFLGGAMGALQEGVGFIARGPFQGDYDKEANLERGGEVAKTVWEAPVFAGVSLEDYDKAWQAMTRPAETLFIQQREVARLDLPSSWWSADSWAAAWREAEDRTIGEAFADMLFTSKGETEEDLDRRRRTNSWYGLTSFAAELYAGFKFDPAVLGAKGIGEAKRISIGAMPRGITSKTAAAEAERVLRSENPRAYRYRGYNPAGYYGTWRGQKIYDRFDALRAAAVDMDFTDFSNLPMFRNRAVNGAQAAHAFQLAAKDDKLWDLTRRLVMSDPKAWHQLKAMRENPEQFPEYFAQNTDAATFIDAVEATKTKMQRLEAEVKDLDKRIADRGGLPEKQLLGEEYKGQWYAREVGRGGFAEYYTWELHRDMQSKLADLAEADAALKKYGGDYAEWLRVVDAENGLIRVDQVSTKPLPKSLDGLSSRTYHPSIWSPVHQVSKIAKSTYLRTANTIDLHRADSGVMSIRRQFEQFKALFNYTVDRDELNGLLTRFTTARTTAERWEIAKEVEDVHLVGALSQQYGLDPQVIDLFLRTTRLRRNEMAEALRAGKGAVYSTAAVDNPMSMGDSVKVVDKQNGYVTLDVMDGGKKHTMVVPEEALTGYARPVDPTQTPQYYSPMDTREVSLAIKHNAELFELLDNDVKHFGRRATAAMMESIDKWGTRWNQLWKPLQLFRLAWPQRVLMDEWFRALAVLGVTEFSKAYFPAMRVAAMNGINPTLHNFGLYDRWKRHHIKIGPGPVADRAAGRKYDPIHEQVADSAPVVPEKFAPRFDGRRATAINDFLRQAIPMRAQRARARALLRDPNPTKSLPDVAYEWNPPENWQDIESALANSDSHSLTLFDEIPPSEDGIILGGTRPENFNTGDLAYAAAGIRLTDEDVINELAGSASDVAKIERFLSAPPQLQAQVWNGDLGLGEHLVDEWGMAWTNIRDFAHELAPGGAMRQRVRDAVERGKKAFEAEVRRRKTGAGHQPLFDGVFSEFTGPYARYQLMLAKELGAKWVPVDSAGAAVSSRNLGPMSRRFVVATGAKDFHIAGETIYEPIKKIRDEALANRKATTRVFDPSTGRETRQGWAVRVNTTELPFGGISQLNGDAPLRLQNAPGEFFDAIDEFILKNQEFLSAKGFRLLVEVDHVGAGGTKLSVVRYFRTDQKDAAIEFARHVGAKSLRRLAGLKSQTKPAPKQTPDFAANDVVGTTRVGNPTDHINDGAEYYIADEDYGPIFEDLRRIIRDVHDVSDEGRMSKTPPPLNEGIGTGQPVLHGTVRELPERLLPRAVAPLDNGRLMGPGFYTTTDPGTARAYGPNLYTIKGTHDGRTYDVRNLYDPVEHDELVDLQRALERRLHEIDNEGAEFYGVEQWANIKRNYRDRLTRPYSWEDVLGSLVDYRHPPYNLQMDEWLLDYLMTKGIGAWRTSWGPDTDIYVWFDTENLVIKPAYERVDRWYKIEEWFAHPASRERIVNQVPESRIIRAHKSDPEFRELETLHAKADARRKDLARQGKSAFRDPVYHALLAREQSMMHRLGLEYSHNMPPGQGDKVNWWTQINPDAPAASRFLDSLDRNTTDMQMGVVGDLGIDPIASFRQELRQIGDRGQEVARRLLKRREFGRGYAKVQSHDGSDVEYHQMFEGEGDIYTALTSAAPTYARMSDTYKRTLSKYRQRAVGYKRYQPPKVDAETLATRPGRRAALEYYAEWSDLLNSQIKNSPIWWRMLDGQTDEQIVNWLYKSHEGTRLRQSLPEKGTRPEKWVAEHRQRLDFYLPNENLQRMLRDRKLRPEDLWAVDAEDLPELYVPDLQMVAGDTGAGRMWSGVVDKIYHALGTVPTDQLSRQPYAKAMYDLKMRNLIAASDADMLSPELLAKFEKLSREFALRQTRRVLYDLADETNFTQLLRFVSPFWGAQQDAITKWMNIMVERPETVARFYVGLDRTYEQFEVIDEDGNPVDRKFWEYNPNDRVLIQIPHRLKKLPFFEKALKDFGKVGISFGAANTALQGDMPLAPSLGPLVTVPADWLADAMWETNGAEFDDNLFYRWLFPIGRPKMPTSTGEFLESLMPGWGRRLAALQAGQDSRLYMNTWSIVSREMHLEARRKNQPPPSAEEVDAAVKWHFALRVVASFAMPAAMEFRPQNQFFLDEYHKAQREYGPGQGFEQFYKKYGADATRYAAASSSHGLVPATGQGMVEWSGIKDIVQDAVESENVDLATAFFSPGSWADDFSSDSYNEQFKIAVGPGMDAKLREIKDPAERQHETDKRLGWVQFRQYMSALNAQLYAMGLTSLEQNGAEELKAQKQAWVSMQESVNPAWGRDYRQFSDTIYQQVGFLAKHAFDPRFDRRPDIQGLRQYLLIRQATAESLDQWAAQGGSRSLQADENTELRNWFYSQVGQLVQANPAFGEFYIRFLDSDRLERGSGP